MENKSANICAYECENIKIKLPFSFKTTIHSAYVFTLSINKNDFLIVQFLMEIDKKWLPQISHHQRVQWTANI